MKKNILCAKKVLFLMLFIYGSIEIVYGLVIGPRNVSKLETEFNQTKYIQSLNEEQNQKFKTYNLTFKRNWSCMSWTGGFVILIGCVVTYLDQKKEIHRIMDWKVLLLFFILGSIGFIEFFRGLCFENMVHYYIHRPRLFDILQIPPEARELRQNFANYIFAIGDQWKVLRYFGGTLMFLSISLWLCINIPIYLNKVHLKKL